MSCYYYYSSYIIKQLKSLTLIARPAQCDEIAELQAYAESNNCCHPIQFWDVPYWSRKQKMTLFK